MPDTKHAADEMSFEAALKELETIVMLTNTKKLSKVAGEARHFVVEALCFTVLR